MGTFKRFIVLILLLAAFLGGYYIGRHPGSPDIFAIAARAYDRVGERAESLGHDARADTLSSYASNSR